VDQFTSNQDQNDRLPILEISSDTFHQWKHAIYAVIVCFLKIVFLNTQKCIATFQFCWPHW